MARRLLSNAIDVTTRFAALVAARAVRLRQRSGDSRRAGRTPGDRRQLWHRGTRRRGIHRQAGTAGTTGTAGTGGAPLPPETELESSYEVPVATGHFIWVANPQSGRVAYVDASTLEVHTVEAGNAPTYMSPIPGADDAVIVLNVLSDDATVLRVGAAGLESRTIRGVAHGANALAVSGDGGWAIAWTDARRVKNADRQRRLPGPHGHQPGSAGGQAEDHRLRRLPAGRPSRSPPTARQAFAVTEDGITVVELGGAAGPRVSKNVIITDDPTENADTRDVSLTAERRARRHPARGQRRDRDRRPRDQRAHRPSRCPGRSPIST